jgi:hypothetical protein
VVEALRVPNRKVNREILPAMTLAPHRPDAAPRIPRSSPAVVPDAIDDHDRLRTDRLGRLDERRSAVQRQ